MADLKKIQSKIYNKNIRILDCNVPLDTKGISIDLQDKKCIYINRPNIQSLDDEFRVLAHEYGHIESGAMHKLDSGLDLIGRHEYRANRKAVLEFLPVDLLIEAKEKGCKQPYEVAEYLNVPEEFVNLAYEHYKNMEAI